MLIIFPFFKRTNCHTYGITRTETDCQSSLCGIWKIMYLCRVRKNKMVSVHPLAQAQRRGIWTKSATVKNEIEQSFYSLKFRRARVKLHIPDAMVQAFHRCSSLFVLLFAHSGSVFLLPESTDIKQMCKALRELVNIWSCLKPEVAFV